MPWLAFLITACVTMATVFFKIQLFAHQEDTFTELFFPDYVNNICLKEIWYIKLRGGK